MFYLIKYSEWMSDLAQFNWWGCRWGEREANKGCVGKNEKAEYVRQHQILSLKIFMTW